MKVKRLSPDKFIERVHVGDVLILDVRPQNFSRNNYFLKDTTHIPLLFLEEKAHILPKDKDILITDWAMKQSLVAAKFLISQDFQVLGVLKGGIERWKQEGRPAIQMKPTPSNKGANRDFK